MLHAEGQESKSRLTVCGRGGRGHRRGEQGSPRGTADSDSSVSEERRKLQYESRIGGGFLGKRSLRAFFRSLGVEKVSNETTTKVGLLPTVTKVQHGGMTEMPPMAGHLRHPRWAKEKRKLPSHLYVSDHIRHIFRKLDTP
jgi:hypothetical protein